MSSIVWMDRKPMINEALELALEAIDKETTTHNPTFTKRSNNSIIKTSTPSTTTTTTIEIINNSQLNSKHNKTDEEKERNSRNQLRNNPPTGDEQANEIKISKEPIYENIATEMPHRDGEEAGATKIIPSNSKNIQANSSSISSSSDAFGNTPAPPTPKTPMPLIAIKDEVAMLELKIDEQPQKQLDDVEPYYQVPKSSEPYYDAPRHLRPVPVYENIEVFYTGLENSSLAVNSTAGASFNMEPPKEKPPPPPAESPPLFDDDATSIDNTDTWSSDNTYETITSRLPVNGLAAIDHPSPPIKRMNSTKRIKKELRNKRSSFLGIEGSLDDDETYLELTVAPPPDMVQLLEEERRLEKQLYLKAGLCDSSDTGESRDSGVSENHSRQSSEHYTNSSEENEHNMETPPPLSMKPNDVIYQNETLMTAVQTPLLQTVKGNSAESWTESATAAAAATQSLSEATATANAKMLSIEEKIREQEEVLRVERELLQLEQEELKRQRENLILRENIARRELQHGAKMLMSANRHSLQDLNGIGVSVSNGNGNIYQPPVLPHPMPQHQQPSMQQARVSHQLNVALQPQQIYANVPNLQQQYYQVDTDYRKSMSDLNEFSKRMMLPPTPPTKPMRAMHAPTNGHDEFAARQRHSLNTQNYGGSLVKIASPTPTAAPRGHVYANYHHQSAQNLAHTTNSGNVNSIHHGNMTRNTLHALSATPKPKYTDGWVQVQNRKSFDNKLANDPAWVSAHQQKRKSMPDSYGHAYNNHWLVQEAEQRRLSEQQQRRSTMSTNTALALQQNGGKTTTAHTNGKPLPDEIIQTLTERVQSKGIGGRKRFDNYSTTSNNNNNGNIDKSALYATSYSHHPNSGSHQRHAIDSNPTLPQQNNLSTSTNSVVSPTNTASLNGSPAAAPQDKVLSVSGKKKCSHCGDELGRGAAMIIESLLLFYHINCFKCCVCHVQLGDGLNGTDVRVRNHKLHCQNCYSSDDGIKFSCV